MLKQACYTTGSPEFATASTGIAFSSGGAARFTPGSTVGAPAQAVRLPWGYQVLCDTTAKRSPSRSGARLSISKGSSLTPCLFLMNPYSSRRAVCRGVALALSELLPRLQGMADAKHTVSKLTLGFFFFRSARRSVCESQDLRFAGFCEKCFSSSKRRCLLPGKCDSEAHDHNFGNFVV